MPHSDRSAIIDGAATVFARHGYDRASVQAVADATGYSKAGLLHHVSSKKDLYQSVLAECQAQMERARDRVADLPVGPARDRRAIEIYTELAFSLPGHVSLLLSTIAPMGDKVREEVDAISPLLFEAFDGPGDVTERRTIRVTGALVAVGALTLAARETDDPASWRDEIVEAGYDTLGHR